MSRYGGYEGGGRREPERWDPERFNRERGGRQQVAERDIYEEHDRFAPAPRRPQKAFDDFDYPPPPGRRGERVEEKDHFFTEERYGPPARRAPRQERYYEEDEIDSFEESPDRGGGRMMPFDRGLPARRAPPRPGIIRRQSSLDTFDRKPRYPREPPEVIKVPVPGRRRRSPPRYEREVEEIRIAEPDYYGDEEFRGYKEREIITDRRRRGPAGFEEKETFEFEEEEPFPRRGKTRMPGRLGETVIILKALGKEQIDEVISVSKEMNKSANRTTYMIEAPPPVREEIVERREIVIPALAEPEEVPRSVREWDVMSGAIGGGHSAHGGGHSEHGGGHSTHGGKSMHGGKSEHGGKSTHGAKSTHGGGKSHSGKSHGGRSHGGKSHARGHSTKGGESESESSGSSSSATEVIIEHKSSRSKSRHRSKSVGHGAVVEEVGESNAMRNGPLALVLPRREKEVNDRDERSIKAEIKALEAEKKRLKHERELEKEHRKSSKYRSHDEDEVIIERRESPRERDVKIEKDRKGNMAFFEHDEGYASDFDIA